MKNEETLAALKVAKEELAVAQAAAPQDPTIIEEKHEAVRVAQSAIDAV